MKIRILLLLLGSAFVLPPSSFSQGPLSPPGPPGPSMKTLDQLDAKLEKRGPITSSGAAVNITIPGSYYLTKDITFSGNGLVIGTDNITVDLNGFSLVGTGAGNGNGIVVSGARKNIVIRNGTIRSFGGIAVQMSSGSRSSLENLRVVDNKGTGAQLGPGGTVFHCRFDTNGSAGLQAGAGAFITESIATGNTGRGIQAGTDSRVSRCTALANGNDGFNVGTGSQVIECLADLNTGIGISAGSNCLILNSTASSSQTRGISVVDGSSIINCVVSKNRDYGIYTEKNATVSRCTASKQTLGLSIGIRVGDDSSVSGCTVNENNSKGIQTTNNCLITDNIASGNGNINTGGTGINVGIGNRVDGNQVRNNFGFGIVAPSTDSASAIVRNISGGHIGADYSGAPNRIGPLQQPNTATSPWANFQ